MSQNPETLTKSAFLAVDDTFVKLHTIQAEGAWKGKKVHLRKLNRREQDEYLNRQWGRVQMKQDLKAKQQEVTSMNIFGHDSWLCVHGVCDPTGKPLFTEADIAAVQEKDGEVIGEIAKAILLFSNMVGDLDELDRLKG